MSTPADGYNQMIWDCVYRGCFNRRRRSKIGMFADCFPGKISLGDVDGLVEMKGVGAGFREDSEDIADISSMSHMLDMSYMRVMNHKEALPQGGRTPPRPPPTICSAK
jgi:hypothetical protein